MPTIPDNFEPGDMTLCLSRAIECPHCGMLHRPFSLVMGAITVIQQVTRGEFEYAATNQEWIDMHPE